MTYQLKGEPMNRIGDYILESTGIYKSSIEDRIIETLGNWALETHDIHLLPFKFQKAQQSPKDIAQFTHEHNGQGYLPWDVYTCLMIGRQLFSHGLQGDLNEKIKAVDEVFRAEVEFASYFINEVYKQLKIGIFELFIPAYATNKGSHPNPDEISFKACLEYAKDKTSTEEIFQSLGGSPRQVVQEILEGTESGEGWLKPIIVTTIEHVFFPIEK